MLLSLCKFEVCVTSQSHITNRITHEMYHLGLQIVTAPVRRVLFFQPRHCELLESWLLHRVVFPLFYKELVTVGLAMITQIKQTEIVSLQDCTREVSRHRKLCGLSADTELDSEYKLLLAWPGQVKVLLLFSKIGIVLIEI